MKKCLLMLSIFLISETGFAKGLDGDSWLGYLNYGLYNRKSDSGGGSTELDIVSTDIGIGYSRPKGFYYGGIFGSGNFGDDTYSHMGLSIGYVMNGWNLMAHYLLGGTYKSGATSYKDGSGTQIDIGHLFKTSYRIFVGFQISMRNVTYKPKVGTGDLKTNETFPAFKLVYGW